jgi:dihydropteroate synthase type 2
MNPVILGILNITADSFSDGGKYLNPDAALAHASELMAQGAHGIDIGAAASNPKSAPVTPEEEIARLKPVVTALAREGVPVSIDTFASRVQRWALGEGVAWLNDIHGFPDPALYPALADSSAKLIVMHAVQAEGRAAADDVSPDTIFKRILEFFDARLTALTTAGIARDRLIVDPGMGMFLGRHAEASFEVLRRIGELRQAFGLPVLISVSRKSFLRRGRPAAAAGPATLAAELFACWQGADYIRTHDPAALADGVRVWSAILTGNIKST